MTRRKEGMWRKKLTLLTTYHLLLTTMLTCQLFNLSTKRNVAGELPFAKKM